MNNEIVIKQPNAAELMRQATDVAGVSREIVMKTACNIKGKKYVKIEGWQAIAVAHGCVLSARDVEKVSTGIRAIGEVRRVDNGITIASAEGFVGDDEKTWGSRDEYARRAMAQTRAMSRAARSAFAHVVVMIDGDLSTTPAEEIPEGGFDDKKLTTKEVIQPESEVHSPRTLEAKAKSADPLNNKYLNGKWKSVEIHFGKNKGKKLSELEPRSLSWYRDEWSPKPYNGVIDDKTLDLAEAIKAYGIERQLEKDRSEVVQDSPPDMEPEDIIWDADSKEVSK